MPNIGLRSIWSTQDDGNGDHANGAAKDTKMREPQNNRCNLTSDASGGTVGNNSIKGKEVNVPEAQMYIDFSEDDLLGEENELSEAAHDFVGVKRGHSVNVKSATSVVGHIAPGCLLQWPS